MNSKCTCEATIADAVKAAQPQNNFNNHKNAENVSVSHAEFNIDELTYGPFTLKGLHGYADATITDESVKLQMDAASKFIVNLLSGKLADAIVSRIEAQNEKTRAKIELEKKESDAFVERKAKESEVDAECKKAQTRYYNAQATYEEARTKKMNEPEKDR